MRKAVRIEVTEGDREVLERWSRSRSATVRLRERSRIVLMAAGGMTNTAIGRELGTHTDKVGRWRRRYADKGIKGIEKKRPRGGNHGGRCPEAQAALRTEIIRRTVWRSAGRRRRGPRTRRTGRAGRWRRRWATSIAAKSDVVPWRL